MKKRFQMTKDLRNPDNGCREAQAEERDESKERSGEHPAPTPEPPSTPGGRAAAQLSRFRLRQSGPSSRSVRACEPAPSWLGRGGRMADSQAFCVAEERSGHCAVVDGHFLYVWGGYVVRGRGGRAGAARERRLGDDCRHRGTPSGFQEARLRSALHSLRAARSRPGSPNHPTGVPGCVPPPASVAQDWRGPQDAVLCYTVFIATVRLKIPKSPSS